MTENYREEFTVYEAGTFVPREFDVNGVPIAYAHESQTWSSDEWEMEQDALSLQFHSKSTITVTTEDGEEVEIPCVSVVYPREQVASVAVGRFLVEES